MVKLSINPGPRSFTFYSLGCCSDFIWFLPPHQCNMSASLKQSSEWMSSAKQNLGWGRLLSLSCRLSSRSILLLVRWQRSYCATPESWLTRWVYEYMLCSIPTHFLPCLLICRPCLVQICNEFERFSKFLPELKVAVFYGGVHIKKHQDLLKNDCPHIVVGTPGRILALARDKDLSLKNVRHFILDECDKMLESLGNLSSFTCYHIIMPSTG